MRDYVIVCGSTVDMDEKKLTERGVEYIPFEFFIGDESFKDDLGKTMPYKEFYDRIRAGAVTRTSQINAEEYIEFFGRILETGKDVVYVSLSSGLSGTYDSAILAKKFLEEKYPKRKVYCIDSLGASSGYGLLVQYLADMKDEGLSAEELCARAEKLKTKINHVFFSTDLTYYVRGGRVSKVGGFVGTILKICPVLDMNSEGKLIPRRKVMGKKNALKNLLRQMCEKAEGGTEYSGRCYISHSDCLSDAEELKKAVEESFEKLKGKVEIYYIGTTIGSHTGTGTVALFFVGAERVK